MTHHEAPGYYCVTATPDYLPAAGECVEGRLFIDGDQLVCGAGEMRGGGYAETLDTYSESTVRRLFGNHFDPQEFRLEVAFEREATLAIPLSAVSSSELQRWDGSRLRGADNTFAVCVRAPSVLYDPVLLQLGRGGRNRGTGRTRHASLAAWLDASSADPASTPATGANREPDESTTRPDPAEAAGASGANGPAPDTGQPSPDPQSPDAGQPSPDPHSPDAAPDARPPDAAADTREPEPGPNDATPGAETESDDTGADTPPEPTWLDAEPETPALIVKNRSDIRLQPRIRGRHRNDVLFVDDLDLDPGETHRWTEFPQTGLVHLDILFGDGSRQAEQLDERHLQSPPVGIDLYASGVEVHSGT